MSSAYTSDQVSRYLAYVDAPVWLRDISTPRDLAFLDLLHKYHISRIPYENLSLHYNPQHDNSLDAQVLYDKFTSAHNSWK